MDHAFDELGSIEISDEDLAAHVLGEVTDSYRTEALKELIRRHASQLPRLLAQIAGDRKTESTLRVMAVTALGTMAERSETLKSLITALKADDPAVVRRAAEVLGRVGDAEALKALSAVKVQKRKQYTSAARAVSTARRLITYRLGLDAAVLPDPPREAFLTPSKDAKAVPHQTVKTSLAKALLSDLNMRQPGIEIASGGVVQVLCARSCLWLARNTQLNGRKTIKSLTARCAVPMVILKRRDCPDGLHVDTYVLTHPGERGTLKIFGMRPSGIVTHFGTANVSDDAVEFELKALNTSHAYALDLNGRYRATDRKIEFKRSRLDTHPIKGQKAPAVPHLDQD
jgi:hypothetical protein